MATPDIPAEALSLASMTPRAQRIWLDAYGLGYQHGIEREHEGLSAVYHRELHEIRACYCLTNDEISRVYRALASAPTFAELCERRGQPERAARHRELLRARGLVGAA